MPNDMSTWASLKEASEFIVSFGRFVKELIFNPLGIIEQGIHGLQGIIEPTVLVVLAVLIILKMIGFKDMEKWGILSLIIYAVVMIL